MVYEYQKNNRYFAQVADEIKDLAEAELQFLGAMSIKPAHRGIYFNAVPRVLYHINYQTHLINRILAPLLFFDCHSDKYLYKRASEIPWEDFLTPAQTFAVFATVSDSHIKHSKFAALRLKDAVVDYIRDRTGDRPSIDTRHPDLWLNLHIWNNRATISLDTSGGSLHRRGYRLNAVEAPMMETLAAAIIKSARWDRRIPIHDPFCGSGTLLCESYLYASNSPPGILRNNYGFEKLPDYDPALWDVVKEEGLKNIRPVPANLISGGDIDPRAVEIARENSAVFDKEGVIIINRRDALKLDPAEEVLIVCNPPYGIRSGRDEDLHSLFKQFGDALKQRCKGSNVCIYFGNREHLNSLGLRPKWKKPLSNGGLDGLLAGFNLF